MDLHTALENERHLAWLAEVQTQVNENIKISAF